MNPVTEAVKAFILKEFLPGQDPNELTETTPLITSRILDSLATIKLVLFLEEQFKITVQAHETDVDHMNTLTDIANLVYSKRK
jgi:acyl carrier protein